MIKLTNLTSPDVYFNSAKKILNKKKKSSTKNHSKTKTKSPAAIK